MYLLDTNIVSELRRPRPHGAVLAWIQKVPDLQLYLSAVTVGKIQAGIDITRQQDEAKARELSVWLDRMASSWQILNMDAACFRVWVQLMHGRSDTLYEDAMIAATALVHGLTVATQNVKDFKVFKVPLVNPFEA